MIKNLIFTRGYVEMKKNIFIVIMLFFTLIVTACGNDTEKSSGEKNGDKGTESKGVITTEDLNKLYTDPKKYKGYEVEITGKVFAEVEKDEDGIYFQLWADPENAEKNTIVQYNNLDLDVKADQYIKIKGIVHDKFEGENAFGGTIIAPMIQAESVEILDYISVMSPTIKEINVDKEINQHDLIVHLDNIEFADNQTRIYVTVKNNTSDTANFYDFNAKLIVGNKQLEKEYFDSETTGLDEIQSDILPGIEAQGVIVYPAVDLEEASLKLHAEANTDNYELDFEPYVFEIPLNE